MVDEFIKLFTGYQGDFGIADMSSAQLDTEKINLNLIMNGQVDQLHKVITKIT